MSDDWRRDRGCTGKHKHESFEAAAVQSRLWRSSKKGMNKGKRVKPYKCQYCDGFHVGHSSPKGSKKWRSKKPIS